MATYLQEINGRLRGQDARIVCGEPQYNSKPRRHHASGFPLGVGGDLLSHSACSIIGAAGLNFSVRNGKRCAPAQWPPLPCPGRALRRRESHAHTAPASRPSRIPACPARTAAADGRAPRRGRAQAFGQLVPLGSTHRCAPTCGLSTWSSPTALRGRLISGRASRLDAFSAYPFRTRLPGGASGDATGAPLVRPARSSRTKASPPQASDARNR